MRRWVVRLGAIVAIACPGLLAIEAAVGWTVEPSYPLYAAMVTVFALVGVVYALMDIVLADKVLRYETEIY